MNVAPVMKFLGSEIDFLDCSLASPREAVEELWYYKKVVLFSDETCSTMNL